MKMCEQILKKKTAPQYNSSSLNCKKHDVPNNSRYRFAAINKQKRCRETFYVVRRTPDSEKKDTGASITAKKN